VFRFFLVYLLGVNLLTYWSFWLDKRRAMRGGKRISERELLGWALVGGSPGAFCAMRRLRHKTRKRGFRAAFFTIVILQALAAWFAFR